MSRKMNKRSSHRMIGVGIVLACCAASAAFAQPQTPATTRLRPPSAQKPESPFVMNLLAAVVIGVAVMAVSVMPAKRGHQD